MTEPKAGTGQDKDKQQADREKEITEREKVEKAEKAQQEKDDKDPHVLLERITSIVAQVRGASPSGTETLNDKLNVELERLRDVIGPAKASPQGRSQSGYHPTDEDDDDDKKAKAKAR